MKKKVYLLIILSLILQGFIPMPTTSPLIILTLGDAEVNSVASPDTHVRADIDDLETGEAARTLKYATYEPDKWLLDGTFHLAPDPAHIGFVSDTISDASGNFASDPVITITLDAVVDIEQGVTLEFSNASGDYCTSLKVEYKNAASALVYSKIYSPTEYNFFAEIAEASQPAASIKYIVITIYSTNVPYRLARLLGVYVDGVMWDKSNIKAANIIEEIDPISATSPSNELTFSLYNEDGGFSIIDPQGVYASLKENQRIDVYEFVDDARIYMGRFYLKDWQSKSENLAELECVDALVLLEKEVTYGDWIRKVTGDDAEDVMNCIMGDVFCSKSPPSVFDFSIDPSLASVDVYGLIPITNRRAALHQLAFAIGGYVTCSRSNEIQIRPLMLVDDISSWDFILGDDELSGSNVALRPLVTGIKITAHNWVDQIPASSPPRIFDDAVEIGDLVIYPQNEDKLLGLVNVDIVSGDTTATVVSLVSTSDNYAEFEVTGAGRLVLLDYKINIHNRTEYILNVSGLPADTPENIIVIENATLVNPDNVEDVAQRVLDYYAQRYAIQVKLFASEIAVGDSALLPTQRAYRLGGFMERMELDLTGGFVQNTRTVGDANILTAGKYDDANAKIKYTGDWSTALASQAYEGAIQQVGTGLSGYAEFAFYGTQFVVIYSQLTDRGEVDVYVDNVLIDTIDEYGTTDWQHEWESPVYAEGFYRVKLAHVETGAGDVTDLDAIEIK